jgi:hypothetical protein
VTLRNKKKGKKWLWFSMPQQKNNKLIR